MLARLALILSLVFSPLASATEKPPVALYNVDRYPDGAIILSGTLLTAIPYAFGDGWIRRRCPCDPNEVNEFDRSVIGNDSKLARATSDVLVGAAVVVPLLIDYLDVGWTGEFRDDTIVLLETLAVNSGLVSIVKFAIQRPIPLAYSGQLAGSAEGYRSFYSGHTSTAVAAAAAGAMTLNLRHHYGVWPWLGVAAIGGAVGLARIEGGNHFYSDVIVGGLVGAGVGVLVPWLHRREKAVGSFSLAPLGSEGAEVRWTLKL